MPSVSTPPVNDRTAGSLPGGSTVSLTLSMPAPAGMPRSSASASASQSAVGAPVTECAVTLSIGTPPAGGDPSTGVSAPASSSSWRKRVCRTYGRSVPSTATPSSAATRSPSRSGTTVTPISASSTTSSSHGSPCAPVSAWQPQPHSQPGSDRRSLGRSSVTQSANAARRYSVTSVAGMARSGGGEPSTRSNGASGGEPGGEASSPLTASRSASSSASTDEPGPSTTGTRRSQATMSRIASSSRWSGRASRSSSRKSSFSRDGAVSVSSLRHGSPGIGRSSVAHSR